MCFSNVMISCSSRFIFYSYLSLWTSNLSLISLSYSSFMSTIPSTYFFSASDFSSSSLYLSSRSTMVACSSWVSTLSKAVSFSSKSCIMLSFSRIAEMAPCWICVNCSLTSSLALVNSSLRWSSSAILRFLSWSALMYSRIWFYLVVRA